MMYHVYILLDSLVMSIDLVAYIVCHHVSLVVFHILEVLLQGYQGQTLREVLLHYIQLINQI